VTTTPTTTKTKTWLPLLVLALTLPFLPPTRAWAKPAEHKVEIADLKYKPAKLKIKKGDKVVWTNSDDRDHTVVSKDKDKTVDSGKIASGDKFEFTFDKPGTYEYGCDYHPRMKGVIEVTE
jgi:plastocyanin